MRLPLWPERVFVFNGGQRMDVNSRILPVVVDVQWSITCLGPDRATVVVLRAVVQ